MRVKFADRICTAADKAAIKFPSPIAVIFAKAGVDVPMDGKKIPLGKVDMALNGLPLAERLRIKAELSRLGVID